MIIRKFGDKYTKVIAEKKNTALEINKKLYKDVTFIGVDVDTSKIKEIDLEVEEDGSNK